VLDELARGVFPGRSEAIRLLEAVPRLEINRDVIGIARMYVLQKLMPGPPDSGDAVHLAIAAYHGVDFVLTWNIRHLANPNKVDHMLMLNRRLGVMTPTILTPDMLWWEA
jgi:hypothetical protein